MKLQREKQDLQMFWIHLADKQLITVVQVNGARIDSLHEKFLTANK